MRRGAGRRAARRRWRGRRRRGPRRRRRTRPSTACVSVVPRSWSPRWRPRRGRRRPGAGARRASRAAATTAAARPGTRTVTRVEELRRARPRRRPSRSAGGQHGGVAVGAPRDRAQPLGAVVDGVHRGDHGQQHLGGADVGGRLVAADVLLAGLQRQPVRRAALGVDRDADQPAGQVPLEAGARPPCSRRAGRRRTAGRRSAGTSRPRRRRPARPGDSSRVSASRSAATTASAPRSWAASITGRGSRTRAGGAGVLHQHAAQLAVGQPVGRGRRRRPRCPSPRRGCATTSIVCGSASASTTNGPVAFWLRAAHQRHRLGGGGALVEQRGVGGGQPGQVADHGLEVEQRLEPALGDLRLVRRVGGVPARVLEHVAPDHRRGDRAVVAEPDHRLERVVAPRRARAARRRPACSAAAVGRSSSSADADAAGDGGVHQRVERVEAERASSIAATAASSGPMCRSTNGARRRARTGVGWSVTEAPSGRGRSGRLPLCRDPRARAGPPELPGPHGPGA